MDLQTLYLVAQIFGSFSVVISIVGLILTIRHSTKFQKAVVVDSLAAAITSINIPCTESPVLGLALSKAVTDWGSASREERVMASFFLFSFFKLLENAWYQQRSNVLDQAQWLGWDMMLTSPAIEAKALGAMQEPLAQSLLGASAFTSTKVGAWLTPNRSKACGSISHSTCCRPINCCTCAAV
jgi:hypothetical protein